MIKKILKLAGIGFLVGMAVCNIITILGCETVPVSQELVERMGSIRTALLVQALLSGIYGALCMGTTVLYDSAEKLPLAAVSLIHCGICIGPYVPLSIFLGWYHDTVTTVITTAIQLTGYFIVWLIMYLIYKKQTKELNEMQKQYRDKSQNSSPEDEKKRKNG